MKCFICKFELSPTKIPYLVIAGEYKTRIICVKCSDIYPCLYFGELHDFLSKIFSNNIQSEYLIPRQLKINFKTFINLAPFFNSSQMINRNVRGFCIFYIKNIIKIKHLYTGFCETRMECHTVYHANLIFNLVFPSELYLSNNTQSLDIFYNNSASSWMALQNFTVINQNQTSKMPRNVHMQLKWIVMQQMIKLQLIKRSNNFKRKRRNDS